MPNPYFVVLSVFLSAAAIADDKVTFNEHTRPILSDNCFACHGSDAAHRKGKLRLDSRLEVSEHASQQAPSKLGLRPGQTISAEDAIRALVTKSANDAAVVVAEALGGDEETFARMMTRKARALGMSRTVYANASGLPDADQLTTARDQATLGRAIQDRFPRQYRYFATPAFVFRRAMRITTAARQSGAHGSRPLYPRVGFNLGSSVAVATPCGCREGAHRAVPRRALRLLIEQRSRRFPAAHRRQRGSQSRGLSANTGARSAVPLLPRRALRAPIDVPSRSAPARKKPRRGQPFAPQAAVLSRQPSRHTEPINRQVKTITVRPARADRDLLRCRAGPAGDVAPPHFAECLVMERPASSGRAPGVLGVLPAEACSPSRPAPTWQSHRGILPCPTACFLASATLAALDHQVGAFQGTEAQERLLEAKSLARTCRQAWPFTVRHQGQPGVYGPLCRLRHTPQAACVLSHDIACMRSKLAVRPILGPGPRIVRGVLLRLAAGRSTSPR